MTPFGRRNRVMGPARRRNRPSNVFRVVTTTPSGRTYILNSSPSLSEARSLAQHEANQLGRPVEVVDQWYKVIRTYEPRRLRLGARKR